MQSRKYKTIGEIEAAFKKLSLDPNPRSLQAVLRIGSEQIDERGKLGFLRNIVFVSGVLTLALMVAVPFVPQRYRVTVGIWEYTLAAICVICVAFLWRIRAKLDQFLAEEQQIKHMIIQASQTIIAVPGFTAVPLSDDLKGTLKEAMRHERVGPELRAMIDVH